MQDRHPFWDTDCPARGPQLTHAFGASDEPGVCAHCGERPAYVRFVGFPVPQDLVEGIRRQMDELNRAYEERQAAEARAKEEVKGDVEPQPSEPEEWPFLGINISPGDGTLVEPKSADHLVRGPVWGRGRVWSEESPLGPRDETRLQFIVEQEKFRGYR